MTVSEIEDHLRDDVVWRRPTWPLSAPEHQLRPDPIRAPFELFEELLENSIFYQQVATEPPETRAMRAMELHHPVTKATVKARYKELVKRFHPDTHGGDRTTEEKLKIIIEAYKTLMSSLNA